MESVTPRNTLPGVRSASPSPPTLPLETVVRLISPGARARKCRDLLVYLHVPFCSSKCHFCDWVVGYQTRDLLDAGGLRERYVDALCAQIRGYAPCLRDLGYAVTNVYWGGGTPTRLTPGQMARVLATLAEVLDLSAVVEHTAECSPETVTPEHLGVLMGSGLNRVSVGVQSFDDDVLRSMGRAHDAAGAVRAVRLFRSVGIGNYNIDLIAGYPEMSVESLLDSVRTAVELSVPHVSLYMFREFSAELVAVRQTESGYRRQASRAERAASYLAAKGVLEAAGYEEYMVGYFARGPEFRFDAEDYYFSLRGDYFGFGAGAASTLGRCALRSAAGGRYGNSHVRAYIDDPTRMVAAPLTFMPDELFTTVYFKAFATPGGIRFDRWLDQFGFDFQDFRKARPAIRHWFRDQEEAGARFIETGGGIALSPDTRVETMIWRR
jgi:coproporphyrinogen III oxidase-like Fe-S oxidoreductase